MRMIRVKWFKISTIYITTHKEGIPDPVASEMHEMIGIVWVHADSYPDNVEDDAQHPDEDLCDAQTQRLSSLIALIATRSAVVPIRTGLSKKTNK